MSTEAPDTVELVARTIALHADQLDATPDVSCRCGWTWDRTAGVLSAMVAWRRHRATAVLDVLNGAGPSGPQSDEQGEVVPEVTPPTASQLCECERWRNGTATCPVHGTTKPPRVWAMPCEPGPDVTRVRDVHGQCFTRADAPLWVGDTFADDEDIPDLYLTWKQLMGQGPLTEVVDGSQT